MTKTSKKSAKKPKRAFNFYVWLRSGLRNMSRRYPPIFEALAEAKVPVEGDGHGRRKWQYVCAKCEGRFASTEVAVDHIVPTGTLLAEEDITPFILRLFCEKEKLQVLCKECHDLKTISDRYGVTEVEAQVVKQVADFKKLSAREQHTMLSGLYDKATLDTAKNKEQRIVLYKQYVERNLT